MLYPLRYNFKILPSIVAVSSDEHSFGQTITYVALTGVFYFLLAHMFVHAIDFLPWAGPWLIEKWDLYVIGSLPDLITNWLFASIA
ncbi:hypothetical protein D3C73_1538790 [compost metagenome]